MREYARKNRERLNAYDRGRRHLTRGYHRERGRRHSGARRSYHLRSKYGIDVEGKHFLYEKQGGQCAACGHDFSESNLFIDHVHGTRPVVIRGLLCRPCNTTARWDMTPAQIRAVADYIERSASILYEEECVVS